MPTVTNKSRRPLVVPLPGGKKLHLGPGKTGQVAPSAVEHPPLRKLVESGEIDVSSEKGRAVGEAGRGRKGPPSFHEGRGAGSGHRSSGDR